MREAALILLYRLLFILYAEDRDLLPVRDARYDDYALREKVRDDIKQRKDRQDVFSGRAARYWSAIDDLCRAIDQGDASIGLPPYNGGLFDRDRTLPWCTTRDLGPQLSCTRGYEVPHEHFQTHSAEVLTSNGADHPFDQWILPRGARCSKDLLHPETVDASIEVRSVDLVSIPSCAKTRPF